IREALHPYTSVHIATKGGLTGTGPDQWIPVGRPEYLIQQAKKSLRNLGIDPKVPREEQFGAVKQLISEGIIRLAGLSEVSVDDIKAAQKVFPVASVQNLYNLVTRQSEDVL